MTPHNALKRPTLFIKSGIFVVLLGVLYSCSTTEESSAGPTLADIDYSSKEQTTTKEKKTNNTPKKKSSSLTKKTQNDIRKAYRSYVEGASSNDTSRQKALTRLAQLELELSNSLTDDTDSDKPQSAAVQSSLQRTITLLETTLRDYPKAKNNDKVLYQLAQAYDRAGQYEKSIDTLEVLAATFRRSFYYPEAQFRIAERAFARSDYITAEDAYTEVVLAPGSEKFYEKSLFKRGWTRYKQQLYLEALDDYVDAIEFHSFEDYDGLTPADKSQFDEYFRALGLAFSHQQEQMSIQQYFEERSGFKYIYKTYTTVSEIYLKQERYSDAATVLEEYTNTHKNGKDTPIAEQMVIAAWRKGGFTTRLYQAIENYYTRYNPRANYWKQVDDSATYKDTQEHLRTYLTQVSSYFHARYQKKKKTTDLEQAKHWYTRYLTHFAAYASKDHMNSLYAELLLTANQKPQALKYFSLAAFDGDIILDKKSAYSSIVLTSELMDKARSQSEKSQFLNDHLNYSQRFIELYPSDKRSESIATNAAQRAFVATNYAKTIEIANSIPDSASALTHFNADKIKARAYLAQAHYADAEAVYLELLDSKYTKRKEASAIRDSVALAIYRQGEQAQKDGVLDIALNHFTRIVRISPKSKLAATGLYDAIAMSMQNKTWNQAVVLIQEFQQRYPKHPRKNDVSKKLSVAYLNSDQKGKAAQEFEKIAKLENNMEVKMAALWQAAELYRSKKDTDAAIRAYRDYAHTYKTPYAQNIEAMYALTELYGKKGDRQKQYFWQNRIRRDDQKATKRVKTDRTTFIASTTTLALAHQKRTEFQRRKLVEPIAKNLKLKKTAMQASVKLYGQASAYGVQEITTEATNAIGEIYLQFSASLLDSERPKNLNDDELEQYEILLEDQAFPFEEKAIEFYETNMARTQDGTHDKWIDRSFNHLEKLFPVRYMRRGKVSAYRG
ncbi:MAG: tetratricopeptide repeat protein [Agarilytica sp.]